MALLIQDSPVEVRFLVSGKLEGALVSELATALAQYQSLVFWQKVVIDLSDVSECDRAGEQLLARILQNGAQFSARTAASLDLLRRVSDRAAHMARALHKRPPFMSAGAA